MAIGDNARRILKELPSGVELEAAAKSRSAEEISEAIGAGVGIIGENYVQEAEKAFNVIGKRARWHFIGHLQKNKVKKAVEIFDMIETVDSLKIAEEIDRICSKENRLMPILIEINSGKEEQKYGVLPQGAELLVRRLSGLGHIKVVGFMTMGPLTEKPLDTRPYFRETKGLYDKIKNMNIPGVEMKYLSMGMSSSYKVAIEEGANIVRIGTGIFGERGR